MNRENMTTSQIAPIILRPLRATVIAYIVSGIALIALGLVLVFGVLSLNFSMVAAGPVVSLPFTLPFAIPLVAVGLVLALRGPRMAAILSDDSAEIRNTFSTRVIPRKRVVGSDVVVGFYGTISPVIVWRDPSRKGRKNRTTVVTFLTPAIASSPLGAELPAMTQQLNDWCSGHTAHAAADGEHDD